METFDFPFHLFSTDNPESGTRVQFGSSYVFSAPPSSPDQRTITLNFATMKFFLTGGVLDDTVEPEINMLRLIKFYQRHKQWKSFLYNHPVHGTLVCKFSTPLKEPKGIPGGTGAVEAFEVQLIEIP